ncbi:MULTISPECIES: 3'(2'),5'-bisphosphate nucleotidase CysQ [unclassified Yoonia]|uniref:3'(2'),5'-bisphosphate nucleotidase CysQ n=1 Tax=unclassified Yoonia TaxID=2629118 RepID=UPI002AFFDD0E|nr:MULTISPECIES: 3'(2'),5'-bisphosphate nucleotidase CysQ [unclassified Yoonia]
MPESDLALLINAARKAGRIATSYFGQSPKVTDKPGGAGPVTEADLAVDHMLADILRDKRPDYGWLSEESPDTAARLTTERQFVIDPIDGTRAFIDGAKDWSHSLAIVENGAVIAAVVYLPLHDLMFTATAGGGAQVNDSAIRVSTAPLDTARVLASKPNFAPHLWKDATLPPFKQAFRSSLAYRLCLVAQGRFDAMLTLRPSWEWDIAAGALIVAEARGTITDQSGQRLIFNNPHPQVPGVIAAGQELHASLAARLEPPATKL